MSGDFQPRRPVELFPCPGPLGRKPAAAPPWPPDQMLSYRRLLNLYSKTPQR